MIVVLTVMGGCGGGPRDADPLSLEFRAAETEPSEGLVERAMWNGEVFYIAEAVLLDNRDVARALVAVRDGKPEVELFLTEEGARRWARATELRLGKRIGMLVDGRLISAPLVRQPIMVGRALLQGNFSHKEAERIARGLNP
jgi:preprotein translocase subunit SecD